MEKFEQLALPVKVRPHQEVTWFIAKEVRKKRLLGLCGHKLVTQMVTSEADGMIERRKIDVDDIGSLKDPDLRYALRFAAAADAAGWIEESPDSYSSHYVTVDATDEGADSRLIAARYSGLGNGQESTFVQDLRRSDHEADENHCD